MSVPVTENIIQCGPGTILPLGKNNRIAYEKHPTEPKMCIQMSSLKVTKQALAITFPTQVECKYFETYLDLWNKRDKMGYIHMETKIGVSETFLYIDFKGDATSIAFNNAKTASTMYATAVNFRNDFSHIEAENYDRFWFSIYPNALAALYGSLNAFDFKFGAGTTFAMIFNAADIPADFSLD